MPKTTNKYATDSDFVRNLEQDITAFIKAGTEQTDTEDKFNELALRLFEYQYNANAPYQKYCAKRGIKPGDIESWEEIPAVPMSAFKEIPLCTFPPEEATGIFRSSGTTNPEKRSKIYLNDTGLKLLDTSYMYSVVNYLYPSGENLHTLFMSPPPHLVPPDSVLMYGYSKILANHTIGDIEYFMDEKGFNLEALVARLRKAEETGESVFVISVTTGYLHFFNYCLSKGISFNLPEGSRLGDGGGYKGRSREISKKEFFELAQKMTGVPPHCLINGYSMTELQTAFCDNVLYNYVKGIKEPRYKLGPPWTRSVVVDPETLQPLTKGETGLLRHYCLANINTVLAVQTDDLGYQVGDGFEVVGRAKGAEARGCSIAMDELISAQGM